MAALALSLILALTPLAAQDKPWTRPGTEAGQEIIGPDGGRMVWVPAGEFRMGSEDGPADERPVHTVAITRGFWLSKCEVSIAQWRAYCRESGKPFDVEVLEPADTYPMVGVNWHAFNDYCRFYGLSMLTEAQWEYAARGPEGRRWPWGNEWDPRLCCNKENQGDGWWTSPVGSFPGGASWCGALDMAGNMAEWCADWYAEDYYANSPAVDPTGPLSGTERVQRGGYCWAEAKDCRGARRFADDPANDGGAGCLRPCYTP